MKENKKILTVMPVLKGGGAERVSSMLTNEFMANGFETEYLLTSSDEKEIINRDLREDIPVTVLRGFFKKIMPQISAALNVKIILLQFS